MADDESQPERGSAFATESLEKWTPRFVTNGVDANDLDQLRTTVDSWADWCPAFVEFGERHADLGEAAEDRDDLEGAGRHFTQASMYYHFGSHVWHEDEAVREEAHRTAVELFLRGGAYLDPPVQRLEAPYESGGFDVPGNLRVPERGPHGGPGDSPLVVLLPGLDSIKEELSAYDDYFLDRGLATLAVDGAAQGETWQQMGMSPDYPATVSAVVDHVESLDPDGVDVSALGVMGVSLGGFYAPYAAAHDDRFGACAGISGPFTVGPVSVRESALVKEQFTWACQTDSLAEVDRITEAMSLRDCIDDLTCPSLMVTGAKDTIVYPEETERIAVHAPNAEYLLYEEGNHVCNNIPYEYKPYIADWFRRELA